MVLSALTSYYVVNISTCCLLLAGREFSYERARPSLLFIMFYYNPCLPLSA